MTTGGEGGMVTCNDRELWSRMWSYKDHGKSWEAVYEREHPPGFRWLHESFGTNWRLTEMQSAIGRIQLRRMPNWTAARRNNATKVWDACRHISWLRVPDLPDNIGHACYKVYVYVRPDDLPEGVSRDDVTARLQEQGVPCMQGSCSEVYREKAFDDTDYTPEEALPNARQLGETSLMFVCHPTLRDDEVEQFVIAIQKLAE